eukprot:180459-Rhodomonas_salina.1
MSGRGAASAYTAKSNTRNRIPGTKCAEFSVSGTVFQGVCATPTRSATAMTAYTAPRRRPSARIAQEDRKIEPEKRWSD